MGPQKDSDLIGFRVYRLRDMIRLYGGNVGVAGLYRGGGEYRGFVGLDRRDFGDCIGIYRGGSQGFIGLYRGEDRELTGSRV